MKNQVLTFTPNPALDISGFAQCIELNEKTYVQNEIRAPGGNAINAARILDRLGIPVLASGFLGGSIGDEVASLLVGEHIRQHFVRISESTRINVTVSNRSDNKQTRFSFPGPRITKAESHEMLRFIRSRGSAKILVIGGSLPQQFTIRNVNQLIAEAQKRNLDVVVDCPGSVLKHVAVPKQLLFIKPNLEEFQVLTQSRVKSVSEVKKKARILLKMASYICVSSVEGGALLVSKSGCYFGKIPSVKIRSTVGAGDSMVGAIVAQFYNGNAKMDEVLRWGLAAAAATLSETGTKLGQASKIKKLYSKTVVVPV